MLASARLMARITWQLLTQRRAAYPSVVENQYLRSQPAERIAWVEGLARKCRNRSKILPISPEEDFPQQNNTGCSRSQTLNDAPLIRMEGWGPDYHYGRGPA